jgi:hypothetical protein
MLSSKTKVLTTKTSKMKKVTKKIIRVKWIFLSSLITLISSGCRKLVEAPLPTESISDENVYSIDATAIAVLNDIYVRMNEDGQPFQGSQSINLFAGLSADELTLYNGGIGSGNFYDRYYTNNLVQALGTTLAGSEQWSRLYFYIFKCNAVIEGLSSSQADKLTPAVRQQLVGETKFLRAFYYFYLVNMFGDVPLALSTDPEVNSVLLRSPKAQVYNQIITDLKDAEGLLRDNFVALASGLISVTTERVRPTKWAASALLARVYLYYGNLTSDVSNYTNAEERATAVISNTSLFGPLPTLNQAFLKNSREAIWQLQPTNQFFNTLEARSLIVPAAGPVSNNLNWAYLSKQWLTNFESGDQRKVLGNWIDTTIYNLTPIIRDTVAFCYKYKKSEQDLTIVTSGSTQGYTLMTEYFMMLRLGEQYLIRAEARAQQGKIGEAQQDLNTIRNRAGLGNTPASDKTSLLTAILKERQVELFCEWGNRWFDLKRTNNIDAVMTIATLLKSNGTIQWRPYQSLYPLPYSDLFLNNLPNPYLTQNQGY